ncbi:MAG: YjbQ family protein [Armatimonadetes bacterium]|nr:YjbQ family protein [Armatimonadota bacterium]
MVHSHTISLPTKGNDDMQDVTDHAQDALRDSGLSSGLLNVFVVGSTAAVTTIEFEPGLERDISVAMERLAPRDAHYEHEARWRDDNGHSHIRASLIGPSVTVPFMNGELALGRWQQIVLIDFDTRARDRTIIVQVVGE